MTSSRQIEANIRNARQSTGPRSPAGKAKSRTNALKHGLTAQTLITPHEDAAAYLAFERSLRREIAPTSVVECALVERLASLFWRLRRVSIIEAGLLRTQARLAATLNEPEDSAEQLRRSRVVTLLRPLETPEERTPLVQDSAALLGIAYLRFCNLNATVASNIPRYEARLWKEARDILRLVHPNWQ